MVTRLLPFFPYALLGCVVFGAVGGFLAKRFHLVKTSVKDSDLIVRGLKEVLCEIDGFVDLIDGSDRKYVKGFQVGGSSVSVQRVLENLASFREIITARIADVQSGPVDQRALKHEVDHIGSYLDDLANSLDPAWANVFLDKIGEGGPFGCHVVSGSLEAGIKFRLW